MEGLRADAPPAETTFVVVLWRGPGVAAPPALSQALGARGIITTEVVSAFMALAVLCRIARDQDGRPQQSALVIVNPETLTDAGAVCDAAAKYAPGARRWMYGPAANPQLRAIVEADVERWRGRQETPEVVVRPAVQHRASARAAPARTPAQPAGYRTRQPTAPPLRLSGEGPLDPGPKAADVEGVPELAGQDEGRPASLLTPEELRMLLGEDEPRQG